jgi:hypothetical protein
MACARDGHKISLGGEDSDPDLALWRPLYQPQVLSCKCNNLLQAVDCKIDCKT